MPYKVLHTQDEDVLMEVHEPASNYGEVYTYADYLTWRFEERVEILKGKLMKMSAPSRTHQEISGFVFNKLYNHLLNQPCKVYTAPFDVRLPVKNKKRDNEITTVVQPDICVICDMEKLDDRGCVGAPDIVIEILSPGNTKTELKYKYDLYEEAGVKEYWLIHPAEQSVFIYKLVNDIFIGLRPYSTEDTITSSVLPGFSMSTADIFKD